MKIWLLNPPYPEKVFREGRCQQKVGLFHTTYPPLTLAYLASILGQEHNVKIIDCIAYNIDIGRLAALYKMEKPDKIFLAVSTPTIEHDLNVIDHLNRLHTAEFLIFGVHATYFSKELSKHRHIKVIEGEPEKYAVELTGKNYDFRNLPFPGWDFVDLSKYKLPIKNERFVLVRPLKGCPYSCIFCTNPFYSGQKVTMRDVDSVVNELKYVKNLGINSVVFFADTFTINKNWVKRLCTATIKENLKIDWICNSRVDTVDYETLKIMKKAGLWLISFGIESADQKVLDNAKKQIKLSDLSIIQEANSLGLLTFGHFILGLPGETRETIIKTINLAKSLPLDFAAFYIATPFPGTELYEQQRDNILSKYWSRFEYSTPVLNSGLNMEEWQAKAYREFYLNNKIKRLTKIVKKVGLKNALNILSACATTSFHLLVKKRHPFYSTEISAHAALLQVF